ncbi:LON peptidase substrate-binding domain-containing protein, partial [Candidatus Sumerlaeota bacterium]|nr:LON peptidase substrate-binding domain-containing protein [Candidatus Sumerlaeota bacterium]
MAENAAAPMETEGLDEIKIPDSVPIVANAHYVMFPSMIAPVLIQGENDLKMIDEVIKGDRLIGVFAVREGEGNGEEGAKEASFSRIYGVGTIGTILKMLRIPDGTVRLLVHGVRRVRIKEELQTKPFLRAAIEPFQMQNPADAETLASMKGVLNLLKSFLDSTGQTEDILIAATNTKHPGKLADLIASNLQISIKEQQDILEIEDPKLRLLKVQEILTRELEIVSLGAKIQTQIKSKIEKTQRDYMLREQMKAIRKELGEDEEGGSEVEELRGRIKKAKLPEKVKAVAERELKKIETTPPANPEYAVSRTYLDWILSLPWTQKTRDNIVLKKAQKILDEDHFDLEKVKEKILEYLAVVKLRKAIKGPILCLVGAPGVGKTSLGRSIARAMG